MPLSHICVTAEYGKKYLHISADDVYIRDLRIGNFRSNQTTNRIGGYDSNLNRISKLRRSLVYKSSVLD